MNPLFIEPQPYEKCPNPECKMAYWHGLPRNNCPGSFDWKEEDDSAE